MKNAARLNLTFTLPETKTKVLSRHGFKKNSETAAFIKKYVTKKSINYIKEILPKTILGEIISINITDMQQLEIHSHKFDSSVINFYIKTNNERTIFYKPKDSDNFLDIVNTSNNEWLDNNNIYYEILENKVIEEESFTANENECWLLNTTVPHAVKLTALQELPRSVLQIYLKSSYQESLDMLNAVCFKESQS